MKKVFTTENFYGTGKIRFESVILQSRSRNRDGLKYNKLWSAKELGFMSMKYKAMTLPNSDRCMAQNEESCEPRQLNVCVFSNMKNLRKSSLKRMP